MNHKQTRCEHSLLGGGEKLTFLKIHTDYPQYLDYFYNERPWLLDASFKEQQEALEQDGFFWYGYFARSLELFGYNAQELVWNSEPLQRAWARENGIHGIDKPQLDRESLEEICLAQVEEIRPDIVWLHYWSYDFLLKMRKRVDSVKLVLGWVGSSMPESFVSFFKNVDVLLSCAPESVATASRFRDNVFHLDHWYDSSVSSTLEDQPKQFDICFSGCLNGGTEHHGKRIDLLADLASSFDINIFSSDRTDSSAIECLRRPAIFGRHMLQALKNSKIVLNMHADSSPVFASNLRMFEATGVGSCLLTDWKKNMDELFTPGIEAMVFTDKDDCLKKIEHLLNDSCVREAIAKAGQNRCLTVHDEKARLAEFDLIIRKLFCRRLGK